MTSSDQHPTGKSGRRNRKGRRNQKTDQAQETGLQSQGMEPQTPVTPTPSPEPKPDFSTPVEASALPAEASALPAEASAMPAEAAESAVQAAPETSEIGFRAIETAYRDYTRRSFEEAQSFVEKLSGARSLNGAIEAQAEFATRAYANFFADTQKIRQLYSDLVRQTLRPSAPPRTERREG